MKMLQKEIDYKDDLIQKYAEKQHELESELKKRDEEIVDLRLSIEWIDKFLGQLEIKALQRYN